MILTVLAWIGVLYLALNVASFIFLAVPLWREQRAEKARRARFHAYLEEL